jgi:hypothetical protein
VEQLSNCARHVIFFNSKFKFNKDRPGYRISSNRG